MNDFRACDALYNLYSDENTGDFEFLIGEAPNSIRTKITNYMKTRYNIDSIREVMSLINSSLFIEEIDHNISFVRCIF